MIKIEKDRKLKSLERRINKLTNQMIEIDNLIDDYRNPKNDKLVNEITKLKDKRMKLSNEEFLVNFDLYDKRKESKAKNRPFDI